MTPIYSTNYANSSSQLIKLAFYSASFRMAKHKMRANNYVKLYKVQQNNIET